MMSALLLLPDRELIRIKKYIMHLDWNIWIYPNSKHPMFALGKRCWSPVNTRTHFLYWYWYNVTYMYGGQCHSCKDKIHVHEAQRGCFVGLFCFPRSNSLLTLATEIKKPLPAFHHEECCDMVCKVSGLANCDSYM